MKKRILLIVLIALLATSCVTLFETGFSYDKISRTKVFSKSSSVAMAYVAPDMPYGKKVLSRAYSTGKEISIYHWPLEFSYDFSLLIPYSEGLLEQRGYTVYKEKPEPFSSQYGYRARFQIGALVKDLNVYEISSKSSGYKTGQVKIVVKWAVLDTHTEKEIIIEETVGVYEILNYDRVSTNLFIARAYEQAFNKLIQSDSFINGVSATKLN